MGGVDRELTALLRSVTGTTSKPPTTVPPHAPVTVPPAEEYEEDDGPAADMHIGLNVPRRGMLRVASRRGRSALTISSSSDPHLSALMR